MFFSSCFLFFQSKKNALSQNWGVFITGRRSYISDQEETKKKYVCFIIFYQYFWYFPFSLSKKIFFFPSENPILFLSHFFLFFLLNLFKPELFFDQGETIRQNIVIGKVRKQGSDSNISRITNLFLGRHLGFGSVITASSTFFWPFPSSSLSLEDADFPSVGHFGVEEKGGRHGKEKQFE